MFVQLLCSVAGGVCTKLQAVALVLMYSTVSMGYHDYPINLCKDNVHDIIMYPLLTQNKVACYGKE